MPARVLLHFPILNQQIRGNPVEEDGRNFVSIIRQSCFSCSLCHSIGIVFPVLNVASKSFIIVETSDIGVQDAILMTRKSDWGRRLT
jgi:hypothetical protein